MTCQKTEGLCGSCGEVFRAFVRAVRKIGPALFQLPPGLKIDQERLRLLLRLLPTNERRSLEFRNPGWFHPEIYSLLSGFRTAFCIIEPSGLISPMEKTAKFIYLPPGRQIGPLFNMDGTRLGEQKKKFQRGLENGIRIRSFPDIMAFSPGRGVSFSGKPNQNHGGSPA